MEVIISNSHDSNSLLTLESVLDNRNEISDSRRPNPGKTLQLVACLSFQIRLLFIIHYETKKEFSIVRIPQWSEFLCWLE